MPSLPSQLDLLKLFSSYLIEAGLSAVSIKNYLSDLRHFLNFCSTTENNPSIEEVFQNINKYIKEYTEYQKSIFTPTTTTNRRLASIRRFTTFLSSKLNHPALPFAQSEPIAPSVTPELTTDKILEQFRSSLEKEKKTHSTVKNYLSDLNHFFSWTANETPFTAQNLGSILSESQLSAYVTYLKLSHNSSSVISRRQSSIKKLTKFCFTESFIPTNPFEVKVFSQALSPLSWLERFIKPKKSSDAPKNRFAVAYHRYSSLPFTPYLHLAILVLATSAMVLFGYNQIIKQARPSSAATALTPPKRQLSFQGRLTDSSATPITTAVNVVFKLWNAPTAGTQLYTSNTCSITPDQDGIFNTLIGDGVCGQEITSSVFTDNRDVYLELTVGTETLTPRQQIATVGYAINSQTLQGYPASSAATINTVPVIDNAGNINIAVTSPSIISTSGTFNIIGQAISLQTAANSGGDIILQPDALGSGQVLVLGGTTSEDSLRITNANLTSGSLISGYVGNDTATGRLLSLTSGSTETDRFFVLADGRTTINASASANTAALTINQNGSSDLIVASSSGSSRFTVSNGGSVDASGNLVIHGNTQLGDSASDTIDFQARVLQDSDLIPVTTDGINDLGSASLPWDNVYANNFYQNGNLVCDASGANCPASTGGSGSRWQESFGAISPINETWDVLIGSIATSSAKIGFININSGTPTINLANQASNIAIGDNTNDALQIIEGSNSYLAIETTNGNENLTFGNIVTNPSYAFLGTGTLTAGGSVVISGDTTLGNTTGDNITFTGRVAQDSDLIPITTTGTNDLGSALLPWDNLYVNSISQNGFLVCDSSGANCPSPGSSGGKWQESAGAISPINETWDILFGSTATASAKFAFINVNSGTPTASISANSGANAAFLTGTGVLGTSNRQTLQLGDATTGNINFYSASNSLTSAGNLTLAGTISLPNGNTLTGVPSYLQLSNGLSVGGGTVYYFDSTGNLNANTGTFAGNVAVNGGSLTTTQTTANLFNGNATTLNIGGAATTVSIGNGSGTTTVNNALTATGTLTANGDFVANGTNNTLGNAITDNITFTGRVAQDSDLIPITTTGTNDLGSALLPWDNVYANVFVQNGNLVCDATGANCPAGAGYWTRTAGNLYPTNLNDTVSATTSAAVALTITQTGAFNAVLVEDQAADPTPFIIDQSGNVTVGGDLAITGGNITTAFTADSSVTVTGTLTANGTFDSNGDVTIADTNVVFDGASTTFTTTGAFTLTPGGTVLIGDGGDAVNLSGSTISLTASGAGNDITANLVDNNTDALDIQQASNNYFNINTTDGSENISFGNAVTNPTYSFLGTSTASFGGDISVASGITTFGTAVSDGTVEASKFCTGDGETNCVTDFSSIIAGSGYWTRTAGNLYPSTANDTISATTSAAVALTLTQTGAFNALLVEDQASDPTPFTIDQSGNVTTGGDLAVNSANLTTNQTTFNLLNTTATTLNFAGATTTLNIGPAGSGASSILLSGGSADTGCTLSGASGNLTCSGVVSGSTLTGSSYTPGSVIFAGTSGALSQNNSNFFWNNTAIQLGLGTASPLGTLDVRNTLGTLPAATISGSSSFANLIVDQSGSGDIFTASKSGATKFTITNSGDVYFANALTPAGSAGTTGQVLVSQGTNIAPVWTSSITTATIPFTNISSGTNTTAAMVVGTGASLNFSGSGTINASTLLGSTWASPGAIGSTTPNSGAFTTLTTTSTASISGILTVGNGVTNNIRTPYGPLNLDYKSGPDSWATSLTLQDTTGDVLLAGGSAATGCTVTNATGILTCSSDILPAVDDNANLGNATTSWARAYLYDGINDKDGTEVISTLNKRLTGGQWNATTTFRVGDTVNTMPTGYEFAVTGDATVSGNLTLGGQFQFGRFAAQPTALGAGTEIFNTSTNTFQCYNGSTWSDCGGTLYSNTNASVADGSFLTVAHNLNTNDLLTTAWVNAQSTWKLLDGTYKPAIAWEGKDTERGVYHNEVNLYQTSEETNIYTKNLLDSGLLFDTFEDSTKTDSANTTASVANQMGDDGTANRMTLTNRQQTGRVGLMGGQTYNSSTTDNDGTANYLGNNTTNDIFYYDRTRDSSPAVQVELGIDPNWYNGVTLSVATTSSQISQNGTLAQKNPNLTTSYNGSLIKATGTSSTAKTIFITIKSPTTFDWTNYTGQAATAVTITPGTAQTLGGTGVSVTFTATSYNVGDVFRVASWFIESASSTRGSKTQFPERSNIIAEGPGTSGNNYVDIIDADTQKLWMRFNTASGSYIAGDTQTRVPQGVKGLNGKVYAAITGGGGTGELLTIDFGTDHGHINIPAGQYLHNFPISGRNSAGTYNQTNSSQVLVTNIVNDVDAAVIPNGPTQQVTVSGWGYKLGDGASTTMSEAVNLPYTFNSTPNVVAAYAGAKVTTAPASLAECDVVTASALNVVASSEDVTKNNFLLDLKVSEATAFGATTYQCYTWTATGTVSPKQFVVAATGNSTSGGTSVINETDGTVAHIMSAAGVAASQVWQTKAAIADNELYLGNNNSAGAGLVNLSVYYGIHGVTTESATANFRRTSYAANGGFPAILGTATGTGQITSLAATANTSTINSYSNTIYIGTTSGLTVLQEYQGLGTATVNGSTDGLEETLGSAKYYDYRYISEEMIGDIRGMFTFRETSGSLADVSIKGNFLEDENPPTYSVSAVRGTGLTFDNTADYLCSDADNNGTCDVDTDYAFGNSQFTVSAWFKHSTTAPASGQDILVDRSITATPAQGDGFRIYMDTAGKMNFGVDDDATWTANVPNELATSPLAYNDNQWHHLVAVKKGIASINLYIDGQQVAADTSITSASISDSSTIMAVGAQCVNATSANCTAATNFWDGQIDELMLTATGITVGINNYTDNLVKQMYEVGYRALQSHGTGLGGGTADTNQQIGSTSTGSNSIGVVQPDWNNQYMYVGLDAVGLGGVSRIQLNSDTNIKTYKVAANVPTGGPLLISDDTRNLGVGYTLDTVGSAASGVKSMGVDNNATATSGNFVSKTYTLPKNIGSTVVWTSSILDASDASNTLTVQASNDGGSNYVTCTLVNTNTNPPAPEKEYACTFTTSNNSLKVRFQFVRGSTKTNTYLTQYGITWLGQTGFRIEQADANNVRLYNYTGETQNLKLNVTGSGVTSLANPWTDGGSYLYPTGFETLRIYDAGGVNYLSIGHDGTNGTFDINGTTRLTLNSAGDLSPNVDDTQSLGSNTKRWKDIFLGGETAHIGTSTTDEGTISYDTTGNIFNFGTDSTTNGDIAFFTNNLYIKKSTGFVGIGDSTPLATLTVGSGDLFQVAGASGDITTAGDLALNGGDLTTTSSTFNIANTAATTLTIGNNTGATAMTSGVGTGIYSITTKRTTGNIGTFGWASATTQTGGINAFVVTTASLTPDGTNGINGIISVAPAADNGSTAIAFNANGTNWDVDISLQNAETIDNDTNNVVNINTGANGAGSGVQIDLQDTATANGLCHSGANTSTTAVDRLIVACSGAPTDIAEFYPGTDDVDPGDVVSLVNDSTSPVGYRAVKSTQSYDNTALGVVSTIPTGPNGHVMGENTFNNDQNPQAIGLAGRVVVKVSLENGPIQANDWLTTSSIPGVAMKATKTSRVIGRALERYNGTLQVSAGTRSQEYYRQTGHITVGKTPIDPPAGIGKITAMANLTTYDPDLELQNNNNILVLGNSLDGYSVSTPNGIASKIGTFAQATVANFKAGLAIINEITVGNLTVTTKLISPIADIDQLKVIDATVSGTLYADNIKGQTVDKINTQLDLLNDKYATASAILADLQSKYTSYDSLFGSYSEATTSGDPFALSPLATTSATIPSDLALNSLNVHTLIGNDILANGSIFTQSLNSFDTDLYIQPNGDKPVHLLASLLTLYPDGKVVVSGDLIVTGTLYAGSLDTRTATVSSSLAVGSSTIASDSANFGELTTNGLVIASGNANNSASTSGQAVSNTTIGTATIATGSSEITIATNKITDTTLVYITPVSDTQNQVLYVKSKQSGVGFTIAMPQIATTEIKFNYWLVQTK